MIPESLDEVQASGAATASSSWGHGIAPMAPIGAEPPVLEASSLLPTPAHRPSCRGVPKSRPPSWEPTARLLTKSRWGGSGGGVLLWGFRIFLGNPPRDFWRLRRAGPSLRLAPGGFGEFAADVGDSAVTAGPLSLLSPLILSLSPVS